MRAPCRSCEGNDDLSKRLYMLVLVESCRLSPDEIVGRFALCQFRLDHARESMATSSISTTVFFQGTHFFQEDTVHKLIRRWRQCELRSHVIQYKYGKSSWCHPSFWADHRLASRRVHSHVWWFFSNGFAPDHFQHMLLKACVLKTLS
jgi:hypothetical protein